MSKLTCCSSCNAVWEDTEAPDTVDECPECSSCDGFGGQYSGQARAINFYSPTAKAEFAELFSAPKVVIQ